MWSGTSYAGYTERGPVPVRWLDICWLRASVWARGLVCGDVVLSTSVSWTTRSGLGLCVASIICEPRLYIYIYIGIEQLRPSEKVSVGEKFVFIGERTNPLKWTHEYFITPPPFTFELYVTMLNCSKNHVKKIGGII
jgi:hypothetical protein